MAKFFVGQRVRIKWSLGWPELAGEVGTIVGRMEDIEADLPDVGNCEWAVAPDVWGSCMSPIPLEDQAESYFAPNGEQLEPATDANDKISWEECIWKPDHMKENSP